MYLRFFFLIPKIHPKLMRTYVFIEFPEHFWPFFLRISANQGQFSPFSSYCYLSLTFFTHFLRTTFCRSRAIFFNKIPNPPSVKRSHPHLYDCHRMRILIFYKMATILPWLQGNVGLNEGNTVQLFLATLCNFSPTIWTVKSLLEQRFV